MILALALLCLGLAALPAVIAVVNLASLPKPMPVLPPGAGFDDLVSILIPARNEAGCIEDAVRAALASTGVPIEVLVGDDHSTDATPTIVGALAQGDARVRLVAVPALPPGWTGKNHACATLAVSARGSRLLFIDADVTLGPLAAASLARHARATDAALVSGVPRQVMGSLGERLTVPMINLLLLGYLPMPLMRTRPDASLGAACGQMLMMDAGAYAATGGHGAVRTTLHDGVRLPRLLRERGYRTDLVAGTSLASCRMYRGFAQSWAGFSKNAREGMATARALPVWTVLLLPAHVLPWFLVLYGLVAGEPISRTLIALAAGVISLATRTAITRATAEPPSTIALHPVAILVALAIQWNALLRPRGSGASVWKGRSYPVS